MSSAADFKSYTDSVIAAIGQDASPRVKAAFPILIRHLHAAVSHRLLRSAAGALAVICGE